MYAVQNFLKNTNSSLVFNYLLFLSWSTEFQKFFFIIFRSGFCRGYDLGIHQYIFCPKIISLRKWCVWDHCKVVPNQMLSKQTDMMNEDLLVIFNVLDCINPGNIQVCIPIPLHNICENSINATNTYYCISLQLFTHTVKNLKSKFQILNHHPKTSFFH